MGETRKSSKQIRAVRAEIPVDENPTWPSCPACHGTGARPTIETRGGRYRGGRCRWCEGTGAIEPTKMLHALGRWNRIYNRNRSAGLCRAPR